MIRTFTLICILSTLSSGMFLYYKKHETLLVNKNIINLVKETHHIQEQTTILRTEWALLNQPDRLNTLSARILPHLHSINPRQFVRLSRLTKNLPPITKEALPSAHNHNIPLADNRTPHQENPLENSLALLSLEEKPSHTHKAQPYKKPLPHTHNATVQVASNNLPHTRKNAHHAHNISQSSGFNE